MESKKVFGIGLIIAVLFLASIIYADSNGVWHRAEDIAFGNFGSDEIGYGTSSEYVFNNPVRFIKPVQFDTNISVSGTIETSTIKAKPGSNGNVVIQLG